MRKICLFGGSFDPVHAGHIHIAQAAQQVCNLDELIFLPAACSPFKLEHEPLLTDEQKIELLKIATNHLSWASVSTLDLELPRPSYSWRLVEHWRTLQPDSKLYWLMGVDQWNQLEQWARPEYLIENLHFIVHHRDKAPQAKKEVQATFIEGHHPASSSAIRDAIEAKENIPSNYLIDGTEKLLHQLARLSH